MIKRLSSMSSFLVPLLLLTQLIFPMANTFASNNMLPPSNLAVQLLTPDDVKLTWSSVFGANGYKVYEITEGQLKVLGTTTTTSYTVNNLPEGSYSYVVSTLSTEGESGPSAPVEVDIVYPDMATPGNLTYTIQKGNDIVLNWTASQYAEVYNLYQLTEDGQKSLVTPVTGRSYYTVANVPEGTYTYAVSAMNSLYGESTISSPVEVEVVFPTMTAPGNLTYTLTNGSDVDLKWAAVSYATAYKIYEINDGQPILKSTVTGTSAKLSNVPAGDYVYAVHSYSDRFGESVEGSEVSVTVSAVTMTAPRNFTYKLQNVNDIVLSWGSVTNASNYKVYQIIDGQQVLKNTVTNTTVTYTKMPAGDYTFVVYSYSDRFGESAEGSQVSLTVDAVTMEAPSNFAYNIQNGNDIVLSWGSVTYADNYKVYQIVNGQKVLKSTVTGTTARYNNLPAGDYTYEVYSYSTRFGESAEGSLVSFSLVHPAMQPPENLTQTIKSPTSFSLSWTASEHAASYKIYLITDGQKILKSTVTGTTVTYSNIQPEEYTYEVHSYSTRFGESLQGSKVTVTMNGQTMETPTNLTYSISNGNDITLRWTSVSYATSYKIYQVIGGQKVLKNTVTGTAVKYTNLPEGEYDYVVHSFSTLLGESPEGAKITIPLVHPTMVAPENLTYKIKNGNDVVLTWTTVPYANTYKVYELVDGQEVLITTVTSLSATISKVSVGVHSFVVHSVSTRFGESPEGSEVSLIMQEQIMQPPANLTHGISNGNDITLKWDSVTYATAYKIYQITEGESVLKRTVKGTSTAFINMPAGDYTYEVYSFSDRFGESQEGSEISIELVFPTMQDPSDLTQSIAQGNNIVLRWNAVTYAKSYNIYQIVEGEKVLKRTVTGTSTTFTNMPEGEYVYEVYSYSDRFGESQEGSQVSMDLVFPIMQAPLNLTQSISNGNNITLRWSSATYATAYNVYQITEGQKVLKKTVTSTAVTFSNMPEGEYVYEVHSYSNRFGESPNSSEVQFSLIWPVVQPPVLTGTVFNANNITLSWQKVTWANEYRVYEVRGDSKQMIYKGTALSTKVYNLSEDTHSYEVTAFSTRFGESAPSNRVTENIIYPIMQPPVANLKLLSETSAQITWNFITYANGYNIYELIDGEPVLLVENLNNLSYKITNLSYANHEYFVTSNSNSFGESEHSNIVLAKLIVDTEAPVTTINAPAEWINQSTVVTLSATDNETGVAQTFYSLNDRPFVEGTSISVEEEGVNKVSFYSIDKVGNAEEPQWVEVKIDKTAPSIVIDFNDYYQLGSNIQVAYSANDELSGVMSEKILILEPNEGEAKELEKGTDLTLKKPGLYSITVIATDAASNSTEITKQFTVYIPATIDVTPKVIKGNKGLFTVRVELPEEYSNQFELDTATLNGVKALNSNNGYYNQAKLGQFKFERSDFTWTTPEVTVEFRCYIDGYLVIGQTKVKVQK